MKRYKNSTPRATFGIAAIALTVLTVYLSVLMPAAMQTRANAPSTVHLPAVIEADIVPPRIDVFGVREPNMISNRDAQSTTREQS